MADIDIDISGWPLVRETFPPAFSDDAFQTYIDTWSGYLSREEPFVAVINATALQRPVSSAQQALLQLWNQNNRQSLRRWCAGTAVVVRAQLVTGVLHAINAFGPQSPQQVFSDVASAEAWAKQQVSGHTIDDDAALRDTGDDVARSIPSELLPYASLLELFEEPAFMVLRDGTLLYQNQAAAAVYPSPPTRLAAVLALHAEALAPLCRIQRLEHHDETYVVVPFSKLHPQKEIDPRALTSIPPSLERVADALAQGLSDKEIAMQTGHATSTMRTSQPTRVHRLVGPAPPSEGRTRRAKSLSVPCRHVSACGLSLSLGRRCS